MVDSPAMTNRGKYRGSPSFESRAMRNRELPQRSNKTNLKWIMNQVENMSPSEHIRISADIADTLNESSIRSYLGRINKQVNSNFKLHKDSNTGELWIWYCPEDKTLR